jgi:hypothetical protein
VELPPPVFRLIRPCAQVFPLLLHPLQVAEKPCG